MSATRYTEINCDAPGDVGGTCGEAFAYSGTVAEVRVQARDVMGWRVAVRGGKDYCPQHGRKRRSQP